MRRFLQTMRNKLLLSCILATMACHLYAADQPPIEVTSPHFTLVTDAGEKQARHLLDNFERMRWMFQTLFPNSKVDPETPIIVFAAKNRKQFQTMEPQEYLAKGQLDLAGYFLNTNEKNYVLVRLDGDSEHPYATIYHEYTHLQFRGTEDWMPLWLNEGLAEFFQNTDFHEKEVLLGEPNADDILYLRQSSLIPLTTLLRVDKKSPYYHQEEKGSVFYAEAWALTHYLQVNDRLKNTKRVGDYMARMSHHEDSVVAAQEAFGDLKALERQLGFYIQGAQYKQFVLSSAVAAIDPASYKVRVLTQAEFDARRADLMAYIGRTDDARALLKSVLASNPNLPEPHETMGYLNLQSGDRDGARNAYLEAIHLNSQDFLAYYQFANISMTGSYKQDDPQIESSLQTSIKLNPQFAFAYDDLSSIYARSRDRLEDAQGLNNQAVQLDRTNFYFRINAANLFMMRDKPDQAEKVLQFARTLANSPQQSSLVEERLNQISLMRKANAAGSSASTLPSLATVSSTATEVKVTPVAIPPEHPVEVARAPRHTVLGTIRNVHCEAPSYLEMEIEVTAKPGHVTLYTSDYFNLDLSALGFEPKKEMNPCRELNDFKAKIIYAQGSDKTIDGQIVSIELHK